MYNKPRPIDLQLLQQCGPSIGDWVWIRPNSSDWSNDWYNIKLMVTAISWNSQLSKWAIECIDEAGADILYELDLDDLTTYNLWE